FGCARAGEAGAVVRPGVRRVDADGVADEAGLTGLAREAQLERAAPVVDQHGVACHGGVGRTEIAGLQRTALPERSGGEQLALAFERPDVGGPQGLAREARRLDPGD